MAIQNVLKQLVTDAAANAMELLPAPDYVELRPGATDAKPFMRLYEGDRILDVSVVEGSVVVILTCPHPFAAGGMHAEKYQRNYTIYQGSTKIPATEIYYKLVFKVTKHRQIKVHKKAGTEGAVGFQVKAVSTVPARYKLEWS